MKAIYTHDEAALICDMFEDVLCKYNIRVPSPEDDDGDRDQDDLGFYGSVYSDLLEDVEARLIDIIDRRDHGAFLLYDEFSGTV